MSTATAIIKPVMPEKHFLNDNYGIRSWLLTKDHKRIAILYLFSITVFFLVGGLFVEGLAGKNERKRRDARVG